MLPDSKQLGQLMIQLKNKTEYNSKTNLQNDNKVDFFKNGKSGQQQNSQQSSTTLVQGLENSKILKVLKSLIDIEMSIQILKETSF